MNKVKVEIETITKVNLVNGQFYIKEQLVEENVGVKVFITCAGVRCYIGVVRDREELFDYIGPKNFVSTLMYSASEYEWDAIYSELKNNDYEYWIGEDLYKI